MAAGRAAERAGSTCLKRGDIASIGHRNYAQRSSRSRPGRGSAPAVIVIGDVVRLRAGLDWLGALELGPASWKMIHWASRLKFWDVG